MLQFLLNSFFFEFPKKKKFYFRVLNFWILVKEHTLLYTSILKCYTIYNIPVKSFNFIHMINSTIDSLLNNWYFLHFCMIFCFNHQRLMIVLFINLIWMIHIFIQMNHHNYHRMTTYVIDWIIQTIIMFENVYLIYE